MQCAFTLRGKRGADASSYVTGKLSHVDLGSSQARLTTPEGETWEVALGEGVAWVQPLSSLLKNGGRAVEVHAAAVGRVCSQFCIMVDPHQLDRALERGVLPCEETLVRLASMAWAHLETPPGMADYARSLQPKPPPPPLTEPLEHPRWWRIDSLPLFAHQQQTVEWMLERTTARSSPLRYPGNLQLSKTWWIDAEEECLVRDTPRPCDGPSLRGGVLQDQTGKTASVLRYLSCERTASPALLIVPSNLVSHWEGEMARVWDKTPNVVWLHTGSSLRSHTLQDLLSADVVVSTASFLRASKPYAEMAEAALGGRARSRALLGAWARQPNHKEPLVEAVPWGSVTVDEYQDLSEKEVRYLDLLRTGTMWLLTTSPAYDLLPSLLPVLLSRRTHNPHPNLASSALAAMAHKSEEGRLTYQAHVEHVLHLATPTAEEVVRYSDTLEREVMVCTCPLLREGDDEGEGEGGGDEDDDEDEDEPLTPEGKLERRVRSQRNAARALLRMTYRMHEAALKRMHEEGEKEGPAVAECEQRRDAAWETWQRARKEEERVKSLLQKSDSETVHGLGSKLKAMVAFLKLPHQGPIVLVVQKKPLFRQMKAFFKMIDLPVLYLEGSTLSRTNTLLSFSRQGQTLVLCAEDGLGGLHLVQSSVVVLAHAFLGPRALDCERRVIGRCARVGQTVSPVKVHHFLFEGGAEQRQWRALHEKVNPLFPPHPPPPSSSPQAR